MLEWRQLVVKATLRILDAVKHMESAPAKILLVVDEERRLTGTVTDGDVRRGILSGIELDQPVSEIMNMSPIHLKSSDKRSLQTEKFQTSGVPWIPLVDASGRVVGLRGLDDAVTLDQGGNCIVIMAGGVGRRLRPLTDDLPKPMLEVGGRPILETIVHQFMVQGFKKIFMSVNYQAEKIQEYFGDGNRWGVDISYLCEKKPLGTAGALSLLESVPKEPIIVMNGDILTNINFNQLLDFHHEQDCVATMCIRQQKYQVPFGVVEVEEQQFVSLQEKPVGSYFANAGIYVVNPEMLRLIPKGELLDMPELFEKIMSNAGAPAVFPVREYWMDVGRMADFVRANEEYPQFFPL